MVIGYRLFVIGGSRHRAAGSGADARGAQGGANDPAQLIAFLDQSRQIHARQQIAFGDHAKPDRGFIELLDCDAELVDEIGPALG